MNLLVHIMDEIVREGFDMHDVDSFCVGTDIRPVLWSDNHIDVVPMGRTACLIDTLFGKQLYIIKDKRMATYEVQVILKGARHMDRIDCSDYMPTFNNVQPNDVYYGGFTFIPSRGIPAGEAPPEWGDGTPLRIKPRKDSHGLVTGYDYGWPVRKPDPELYLCDYCGSQVPWASVRDRRKCRNCAAPISMNDNE